MTFQDQVNEIDGVLRKAREWADLAERCANGEEGTPDLDDLGYELTPAHSGRYAALSQAFSAIAQVKATILVAQEIPA